MAVRELPAAKIDTYRKKRKPVSYFFYCPTEIHGREWNTGRPAYRKTPIKLPGRWGSNLVAAL
jgi:hypothetical protein